VLHAVHGFGCNRTLVLKSGGTAVQTLSDICIGDVYLFSGQSNIDLPEAYANQFDAAAQTKEEAFADANSDIRLMIISHPPTYASSGAWPDHPAELADVADSPLCIGNHTPFDAAGTYRYCQTDALKWVRANGTVIRGFSATAWFTGTALRKSMDKDQRVPLGLVRSSAGGTKIRMWSSADALAKCTQSSPAPKDSSTLFENMIQPLKGVNFAAVVWYQVRSIATLRGTACVAPKSVNCLPPVGPGRKRCWSRRWLWTWNIVLWLQILQLRAPGHDRRLAPEAGPTAHAIPSRRARRVLQ
jgi:hypothetical protein